MQWVLSWTCLCFQSAPNQSHSRSIGRPQGALLGHDGPVTYSVSLHRPQNDLQKHPEMTCGFQMQCLVIPEDASSGHSEACGGQVGHWSDTSQKVPPGCLKKTLEHKVCWPTMEDDVGHSTGKLRKVGLIVKGNSSLWVVITASPCMTTALLVFMKSASTNRVPLSPSSELWLLPVVSSSIILFVHIPGKLSFNILIKADYLYFPQKYVQS